MCARPKQHRWMKIIYHNKILWRPRFSEKKKNERQNKQVFMAYAFDVWTGSAGAKPQQQQHSAVITYFQSYQNDSSISVLEPPKIKFCSSISLSLPQPSILMVYVDSYLTDSNLSKRENSFFFGSYVRHLFDDLIDKFMIAWPNDNCLMDLDK